MHVVFLGVMLTNGQKGGSMDDLISRQEAIDAVADLYWMDERLLNFKKEIDATFDKIIALPSAQPETHDKCTKTHSCDLIDRQAAIDALTRFITPHDNGDGTMTVGVLSKSSITDILNDLPSVQPEIVRCKDCMYWVAHDKRCVYLNHGFAPNMWCCHGRRTDEKKNI